MGYFSSGKNNSLRSDIFFPARKIPHTPLPTCSTGMPRVKTKKVPWGKCECCTESILSLSKRKTYKGFYQATTRQCPSARGGCWIFCRKKMSERSELFFQKKSYSHTASPPANRKAGSPSQTQPAQPEVLEPNSKPAKEVSARVPTGQ